MTIIRRRMSAAAVLLGITVGCTAEKNETRASTASTSAALMVAVPFAFPSGLTLFNTPLYAQDELRFGAQATVRAPAGQIIGRSSLSLANKVQIGSDDDILSAVTGGPLSLGPHVRITGFAQPGGAVSTGPGIVVSLGVLPAKSLPAPRTFNIASDFGPAGPALTVANQQHLALPPGESRLGVTLKSKSTLHLTAGRYYFADFTMASNSTIDIDDSAGDIIIFTSGAVQAIGATRFHRGPEHLAIVHTGTSTPALNDSFQATIVAPRADLSLSGPHSTFVGSFHGSDVAVGPNVNTRFARFAGWGELLCERAVGPSLAEARSLPTTCNKPSECCKLPLTRTGLTANADVFDVTRPNSCVDAGPGDDTITGCKMAGSFVLGGAGADDLQLGQGVVAYGGSGNDRIESFGNATLFGNDGDDTLISHTGNNVVFPGAGKDSIQTGDGDDVVILFDACETDSGKRIDLGEGHDVVISPFTKSELEARGVQVSGVEEFRVERHPCKAECRNAPRCSGGGLCVEESNGALACSCSPFTTGTLCENVRELPYSPRPAPPLDAQDEIGSRQQAQYFLNWYTNGTVGERGAARQALDTSASRPLIRRAFVEAGRANLGLESYEARSSAVEVLGYLNCLDCIKVLIEAFPMTVPQSVTALNGSDPRTKARALQGLIAYYLAGADTARSRAALAERLANHQDEVVRKLIVFAYAQAYGESVRSLVQSIAHHDDLVAFDWISNTDPQFDIKLRARGQ